MILSMILLAVSINLDAFFVGLTYGVRKIQIPWRSKLILFALSCGFSFSAVLFGRWLLSCFPSHVLAGAGSAILFLMGAVTVFRALVFRKGEPDGRPYREFGVSIRQVQITVRVMNKPESCDMDASSTIDPKEALYLGVALSVDALAAGVASSVSGMFHWLFPLAVALFQFFFLSLGRLFGERFEARLSLSEKMVHLLSGLLLMGIALVRIFV